MIKSGGEREEKLEATLENKVPTNKIWNKSEKLVKLKFAAEEKIAKSKNNGTDFDLLNSCSVIVLSTSISLGSPIYFTDFA